MSKCVRLVWVDWIKGWAMIAVTLNHLMAVSYVSRRFELITIFSVTTLVFLGGVNAGISFQSDERKGEIIGYNKKLIKRLSKLLVPYSVSVLVYCVLLFGRIEVTTYISYFVNAYSIGAYYVIFYLQLIAVAPLIYIVFNKFNYSIIRQIAVLIGAGCLALLFIKFTSVGEYILGAKFVLGGSYFFVFCFGIFFSFYHQILNSMKMLSVLLIIAVGYLIIHFYHRYESIAWANPPNVFTILYSMSCCIILYVGLCIFMKIFADGGKIVSLISYLGKNSLYIYLYHSITINILHNNNILIHLDNGIIKTIIFLLISIGSAIVIKLLFGGIVKLFTSDSIKGENDNVLS